MNFVRNDLTPGFCVVQDLFVKKGWLLRLGITKEWFKHWFVLRNNSLTYFRHSSAEDSGILDGVVDLGLIKSIKETDSKMHFAFCITVRINS